jgi:hypothetical protein
MGDDRARRQPKAVKYTSDPVEYGILRRHMTREDLPGHQVIHCASFVLLVFSIK